MINDIFRKLIKKFCEMKNLQTEIEISTKRIKFRDDFFPQNDIVEIEKEKRKSHAMMCEMKTIFYVVCDYIKV